MLGRKREEKHETATTIDGLGRFRHFGPPNKNRCPMTQWV